MDQMRSSFSNFISAAPANDSSLATISNSSSVVFLPSSLCQENSVTIQISMTNLSSENEIETIEIPYDQYLALTSGNNGELVISTPLVIRQDQNSTSSSTGIFDSERKNNPFVQPSAILQEESTLHSVNALVLSTSEENSNIIEPHFGNLIMQHSNIASTSSDNHRSNNPQIFGQAVENDDLGDIPKIRWKAKRRTCRQHSCPYPDCEKTYTKAVELQNHLHVHAGERPYKCSTCDKQFGRFDCLRRHQLIHSGEKKFECPYCSKKFLRKNHLTKHIKKIHQDSHTPKLTVIDMQDD